MFTKFIALLMLMLVSFATTIFVFIKGWGLNPENWWIIIFGLIANIVILSLNMAITRED